VGSLSPHWKILSMAKTPIRLKINQAFDVHASLPPEFPFNGIVLFEVISNLRHFVFVELIGLLVDVDVHSLKNGLGCASTNAKDVRQPDLYSFISWKIYPCNACHNLPLPLFMAGVFTGDSNNASAPKYSAFIANFLYGRPHFHDSFPAI
jgi:hypothetical protein